MVSFSIYQTIIYKNQDLFDKKMNYKSKEETNCNFWIKKIAEINEKVSCHNELAAKSICLIASGNVVSPMVHKIMESDLIYRAAEGGKKCSHFPGLNHFYEIEENAENVIAEVFNADFADLRPISGTQANMIVYTALTKIGDKAVVASINSGSHVSQAGHILSKFRKIKLIHPKTHFNSFLLDINDYCELICSNKPSMVLLGGSVCYEWQDLTPIISTAHENGSVVIYDSSHIAALIATKVFPNPMDFGVDIMTMTTCKTIPGPSHAWILGKSIFKDKISKIIFPGFVSGGHLHEYVGAIVSLYEVLKHGRKFGEKIVKFANLLATELNKNGILFFKTREGSFTQTHQIISYSHFGLSAKQVKRKLSEINIFVNANLLPENSSYGQYGIRWGVQEIVRLGAREESIIKLSQLITRCLKDRNPNIKKYIDEVSEIKMNFSGISFC